MLQLLCHVCRSHVFLAFGGDVPKHILDPVRELAERSPQGMPPLELLARARVWASTHLTRGGLPLQELRLVGESVALQMCSSRSLTIRP